jgi:hypothetical protein
MTYGYCFAESEEGFTAEYALDEIRYTDFEGKEATRRNLRCGWPDGYPPAAPAEPAEALDLSGKSDVTSPNKHQDNELGE